MFQGHAVIGRTVDESEEYWPPQTSPPEGTPNIVLILLDDVGFSQLGCFGSDIETPHIDRLAAEGLRYVNFHTTALCSPTRASLLTGRNPHSVGFGHIVERAAGFPGYSARLPDTAATIAEVLRQAGYSTRALGKWHLTPSYETGPAGPFERWPLGRGFERFYGFLGGSTDQYSPELYRDNCPTDPPASPEDGYHLTADLTDEAIDQIRELRSVAPNKPYFLYMAPGACHAPHQAPPEFTDHYRGRFDAGWDEARRTTLERQLELGIVPNHTELPPANPDVPAWDSLSDEERRLYARMMEVYAGFLSHTDAEIGRFLEFLREIDDLDNTVVILLSDNGASAEGGPEGSVDEALYFNDMPQRATDALAHMDELGGPRFYNHYPWGWAQAGNTPFRWYKQFTHAGGIRTGCIIRWPSGIDSPGTVRTQYHHVVDIAPTLLDIAGIDLPEVINGAVQQPLHGVSMAYTFTDAEAEGRRRSQHYEMWGNRGMWADGWMAISRLQPDAPGAWPAAPTPDRIEDVAWELYDHRNDPSEAHDVSARYPDKLRELTERWWADAGRYNVLPIDTRARAQRWSTQPDPPGADPNRTTFLGPSGPYERGVGPKIAGRSFRLTAEITVPDHGEPEGVLYALGGVHGGYTWYLKDGNVTFEVNLMSVRRYTVELPLDLTEGRHLLEMHVVADHALTGNVTFSLDGEQFGGGQIGQLLRLVPIGSGRTYVGYDDTPTVSDSYNAPFAYNGVLHRVTVTTSEPTRDQTWREELAADLRAQ